MLYLFTLKVKVNTLHAYLVTGKNGDSSVGIVTRYGLDGTGIESWWGRDFPHPSRQALWPTQPPIQLVPGLSPGVKQPDLGFDHPHTSSADVKKG